MQRGYLVRWWNQVWMTLLVQATATLYHSVWVRISHEERYGSTTESQALKSQFRLQKYPHHRCHVHSLKDQKLISNRICDKWYNHDGREANPKSWKSGNASYQFRWLLKRRTVLGQAAFHLQGAIALTYSHRFRYINGSSYVHIRWLWSSVQDSWWAFTNPTTHTCQPLTVKIGLNIAHK